MKVNSLTHMVVVVDENSGESATAALEEQLQVRCQPEAVRIYSMHNICLLSKLIEGTMTTVFICSDVCDGKLYFELWWLLFILFSLVTLLQSLGERWAAVCRWTEERWHKLQEVLLVWQQLQEDQVDCAHDCDILYDDTFSLF